MLSRPAQVYGTALPRLAVPRDMPVRHGARLLAVVAPRRRTAAIGVATVVALTLVALFYLSQTFEAASARYQVDTLLVEREELLQELKSQEGATVALRSEATVTQWAQQQVGLEVLGHSLALPAR